MLLRVTLVQLYASQWRPWHAQPCVDGWVLPLAPGVAGQAVGYGVTVHDQPVEHERKVNVG